MFKVWLPRAKIDPLVISVGHIILGFWHNKICYFSEILRPYFITIANAKSSLISQQVRFLNKKSKKT